MRIAFITSCLEPEMDGVGDYVRLIATQLNCMSNSCAMFALNDRYADRVHYEHDMRELRIPAATSWRERRHLAGERLADFDPHWVSLQFVCYGWHPQGVSVGAVRALSRLLDGYRTHVMFHELEVGLQAGASLKERVLGLTQHKAVLGPLLRGLQPMVVHTSNQAYAAVLREIYGVHAKLLPLCGNVPVTADSADSWLFPALDASGVSVDWRSRPEYLFGGYFGSIYPGALTSQMIGRLVGVAAKGHQLVILSAGRRGLCGDAIWRDVSREFAGRVPFVSLGVLPGHRVSEYLNSIDFGIAAAPWLLMGKSGSAAAMMEHDLPILVPRNDIRFRLPEANDVTPHRLWLRIDSPELMGRLLCRRPRRPASLCSLVAQRLLEDLGAGGSTGAHARGMIGGGMVMQSRQHETNDTGSTGGGAALASGGSCSVFRSHGCLCHDENSSL